MPGVLNTPSPRGSGFALVDDVAGTGASLERSVLRLRELGQHVVGAWVVVDRLGQAAARLAALGMPLHSLLTLDELRSHRISD
ncbi:phosphoribosyltransferase family protein [Streptomyces sp. NPDC014006]|uniref:phosphoribosyltransferase family protein n=1 Tax=Streptomyces sp. NPDC014006 TaxID=3364870 RepID=UPI0036FFE412